MLNVLLIELRINMFLRHLLAASCPRVSGSVYSYSVASALTRMSIPFPSVVR